MITIDAAIELCENQISFSNEEYMKLAEWLEELKLYRLAIKQCKESSYMVNSKEFAKHMEEWVNKGGGVNDD